MKPKSIILHGQRIGVQFSDPGDWADNGMGRSNSTMGRIIINSTVPDDLQSATFLHEVIHQSLSMNGLTVDEHIVGTLANSLFGFLRDNESASDWICGRKPFSDAVMDAISEAQQQRNA